MRTDPPAGSAEPGRAIATASDAESRYRSNDRSSRLAIYIPTLDGGGAESSMLRIADGLRSAGWAIDLVVNRRTGALCDRIPAGIRVIELVRQHKLAARLTVLRTRTADWPLLLPAVSLARYPVMTLPYVSGLAAYLREQRPSLLISAMFYTNLVALWARDLSGIDLPIVVTEHTALSARIGAGSEVSGKERIRWRHLPRLIASIFPRADAIVAVSTGVADDLARLGGLPRSSIRTIYNPVITTDPAEMPSMDSVHRWLDADAPPVILAVGRLEPVKDFAMLIDAFARLRAERRARLIILGEGALKNELAAQAQRLGIAEDVDLPGWVESPRAFMRHAAVVVSTSRWEGLGNVLIEAMSCGCPVVSTDCPYGPREILFDGQYGRLVPVGQPNALAAAIAQTLDELVDREGLMARADRFSVAASVEKYAQLARTLLEEC